MQFIPAHEISTDNIDLDAMPELFRVVADGNGRWIATTEEGEPLGAVVIEWDGDTETEIGAARRALTALTDGIVADLVDPMN